MQQLLDFSKYSSESDSETNSFLNDFPLSSGCDMAAHARHPFSAQEQTEKRIQICEFVQRQTPQNTETPKLNAMNLFAFRVSFAKT